MNLGDFRADGWYLSSKEREEIRIRSDKNSYWLIGDNVETMAKTSDRHAYDMFVRKICGKIYNCGQKFICTRWGHECQCNVWLLLIYLKCFFPGWNNYTAYIFNDFFKRRRIGCISLNLFLISGYNQLQLVVSPRFKLHNHYTLKNEQFKEIVESPELSWHLYPWWLYVNV